MKNILYSPWRIDYIVSQKNESCVFCFNEDDNDEDHFVIYRSLHCYVIINTYPYNNGHIMVNPNRHVSSLSDLNKEEIHDLFETVQLSEIVLKNVYNPEGINCGINIGKAAGAGIKDHLHVHLLPRWSGDSNFITTLAGTRVIPEEFSVAYKKLKEGFEKAIQI